MVYIISIVVVGILLILYTISTYNKLKFSEVNVDEAFGGIETYLEERFDMLTKLISTAKEESNREIGFITDVTKMRSAFEHANTIEEKVEAGMKIEAEMPSLLATMENYPDPKFNEAFRKVQQAILAIEDKLSAARRNYNSNVSIYNKHVVAFPASIIASIFGLKRKKMFEATTHKRNDVDIDNMWAWRWGLEHLSKKLSFAYY